MWKFTTRLYHPTSTIMHERIVIVMLSDDSTSTSQLQMFELEWRWSKDSEGKVIYEKMKFGSKINLITLEKIDGYYRYNKG